ncbi:MAG TPA: FIST N-terminal domain-containing protein [Gemmataceae bacterium]|nr:FIST N-terminal domain-containing protein [Gemmataceae bacterium]
MPFAAALSTAEPTLQAVEEVCAHTRTHLPGEVDLAILFFSTHHARAAEDIVRRVRERLAPRCLLGCVAESVVGNDREIEQSPALSLWASRWAHPVTMDPFHLVMERTADGPSLFGWPDELGGADGENTAVLLLGDPFTFPIDLFLRRVNEDSPGVRVLGGMASGIRAPGQCRLLFQDTVKDQGAAGVFLRGSLGLRSIVSQGCRPIGRHLVITRAQDNLILELGGQTPLAYLQELWPTLSAEEQNLFQQGLHIGRVLNEYQGDFLRGDFLVRNVLALERETGSLAITDRVRVGQTVQFHVRDAATADEDLHALLRLDMDAHDRKPSGALLFSCNGRGTRLFPEAHHDARVLRAEAGDIPVAGFFAQGELGPVGGQNFIHGFTASVALFEE